MVGDPPKPEFVKGFHASEHLSQADPVTYTVDIADTPARPLLIYCYVIANDNLNHLATTMGSYDAVRR